MKFEYVAVVHKADKEDADYGGFFPDLPGCVFGASKLFDIALNARDSLEFHLEALLIGKDPLPLPTPIEVIRKDEQYKDCIIHAVSVEIEP